MSFTLPARRWVTTSALAASLCAAASPSAFAQGALWTSFGQNTANTRYQATETGISVASVSRLGVKWVFTTEGDVSATPAVDGARVYFPDWKGNLYAVDRRTGQLVWKASIPAITGIPGDKARATPTVESGKLIIGTQGPFGGGGKLLAFDKNTGVVLWATQLDNHPAAIVTQSATVAGGVVYVGVSSQEEGIAALVPEYTCCSFRGSLLALDLDTGAILWRTFMLPQGYTGAALWGSMPVVDNKRGQLYVATGNNYSVPPEVLQCVAQAAGSPEATRACIAPDDHFDSVLAVDLKTGAVRWATKMLPYDAWTVDCIPGFGNLAECPNPAGPDYDFGQGPSLYKTRNGRELLGAGQKSGQYWALNPATGAVVWVTQAGPGGTAGGLQWGSSVDGARVYTANANSNNKSWTLPDGSATTTGVWSGLDAATGQLLWQTVPSPAGSTSGPTSTTNGVVFACALDPLGTMYAMNGATGQVLWTFTSGGSCLSGAAITQGEVFWGSGYSNFGFGTPNNKLYAFELK
jgi:polyvinyl alcohol dehydrogenase (cytochrome)